MRDRLIELLSGASDKNLCIPYISESGAENIADYLIENGVIVPPCKAGQTVYRITKLILGETIIVEGEVFEITITHEYGNKTEYRFYFWAKGDEYYRGQFSLWCNFADFGKTVFLTKEEAEKALRGEGDET